MMKFDIEIKLPDESLRLNIEELDPWPDADGYVRYEIHLGVLSSIIAFDTRYWIAPILLTAENVSDYFETIHYPDVPAFYSEDNTFSEEIIELIRCEAGKYIIQHKRY